MRICPPSQPVSGHGAASFHCFAPRRLATSTSWLYGFLPTTWPQQEGDQINDGEGRRSMKSTVPIEFGRVWSNRCPPRLSWGDLSTGPTSPIKGGVNHRHRGEGSTSLLQGGITSSYAMPAVTFSTPLNLAAITCLMTLWPAFYASSVGF